MEKNLVLTKAKGAVLSHDFTTAARLYKQLLAEDPSNVDYLKQLGSIYVQNQEDEKAIPYYEQIITFYPHYVEAMNSLGAIYRRLKRYQESIDILQKAIDEGRDLANVNYNLGFTYKEMGNYEDAIDAFQFVIHENPSDVLAYNHLGSIYMAQKNYEKSIAAYKRGLQIDQNHPILNYNLARCYEAAKNPSDAIRCYQAALKTRPGWVDAINDFSELLIKCQKNKDAQNLVQQSIKLHPTNADLLRLLGKVYLNQYDYSAAEKTFKKADSYKQNDVKILSGLAEALEKGDKVDAALDTVLSAIEVDPENKDIRKQYVHTLLTAKDYEAALSNVKELYEETDAKDLQVLDLYGQYYICKDDEAEAQKYYEKIKKINHHYTDYILSAANRYNQIGNYDGAEKFANDYIERRPNNPDGYNVLGHIFEKKGELQKAIDSYNKSLSLRQPNILANQKIQKFTEQMNIQNMPVVEPEAPVVEEALVEEVTPQVEEKLAEPEEEEFDFSQMGGNVPLQEGLLEDEQDFFDSLDEEEAFQNAEITPVDEESAPEEDPKEFKFSPANPSDIFGDDGIFDDDAASKENGSLENGLKNDEEAVPEPEVAETPAASFDDEFTDSLNDSEPEPFDFGDLPTKSQTPEGEQEPAYSEPEVPPAPEMPAYNPEPQQDMQAAMDAQMAEMERRMQQMAMDNVSHAMEAAFTAQKMAQQLADQQQALQEKTEKSIQEALDKVQEMQEEKLRAQDDELASLLDDENIIDETPAQEPVETDAEEVEVEEETFEAEESEEPIESEEIEEDSEVVIIEEEVPYEEEEVFEDTASDEPDPDDVYFPTVDNLFDEETDSEVLETEEPEVEEEIIEDEFIEEEVIPEEIIPEENIPEEASFMEADDMLAKIERILSDDSVAEEYAAELELFKKLKVLSDYLPAAEKNTFVSGRNRMLIEYIICKMSGKPGLLDTSIALLKSGVLGEEYNSRLEEVIHPDEDEVTNELIRVVLTNMKEMADDLTDRTLVEAMRGTIDNILERIELENQKSKIF